MSREKPKISRRYLKHYGMPRRSGRYPWGSGKKPQRNKNYYNLHKQLHKRGYTDKEIAAEWNISQAELKRRIAAGLIEVKEVNMERVMALHKKGYGPTEIMRRTGIPEGTVRGWIKNGKTAKITEAKVTADTIKEFVDKYKYVDIGEGTEITLDVTKDRMATAVEYLKSKGYHEHTMWYDQMGTGYQTTVKCLVPPDVTYEELREHKYDVQPVRNTIVDIDGTKLAKSEPINNIDINRVAVRYAEEGGSDRDGTILLRRGCEDLNLGNAAYAQVRIGINGTHYAKGVAFYGEDSDFPPGCDILINSNKKKGTPVLGTKDNTVLKLQKNDADNPFGTSIKDSDKWEGVQKYYIDSKTGEKKVSALNLVNEEGDWYKWNKSLSSQFLSKQRIDLAKNQLNIKYTEKVDELNSINSLTNPVVRKILLAKFADSCDGAAQDLKAAALPGQRSAVILPAPTLGENEIYAPYYKDGTKVVTIRHPHASITEIPVLTVNNNNEECKKMFGGRNPIDAVCIHPTAAKQMSGADFDGDTVLVIPANNPGGKVKINAAKPFDAMRDFDPGEYKYPDDGREHPIMTDKQKGKEMGRVSNLISDMTLQRAPEEHMVRAMKHSMVVIDAQKHEYDWRKSERENDIKELIHLYQKSTNPETGEVHYGGASTIVSKAKSEIQIPEVKPITGIYRYYEDEKGKHGNTDPNTGELIRIPTGSSFTYILDKKPTPRLYKDKVTGQSYSKDSEGGRHYYTPSEVADIKAARRGVKLTVYQDKDGRYYTKDPVTKERTYRTEDEVATRGVVQGRTTPTTRMANTKDAYTLTSGGSKADPGHPMEGVYAEYANNMKALANQARLDYLNTPKLKQDKEAKIKYKQERDQLEADLKLAKMNAPKERRAQILANHTVDLWKEDNPDYSKEDLKKYKGKAISIARKAVGAKKPKVEITDRKWEAIQAGAVSTTTLRSILNYSDMDRVRELAIPKDKRGVNNAKLSRAKSLLSRGYTQAEVAEMVGLSVSTLKKEGVL